MAKTTIDTWNPDFPVLSPIFSTLQSAASYHLNSNHWPTPETLSQQFRETRHPVKPVPQGKKPETFEDHYEPRIYLKHELQTRTENWHDFFNAMIWLTFRETKSVLNKLHYFSALQRDPGTNRSKLENAITLFDECGIIVISNNKELLEMIRQHQWKQLFYHHREQFNNSIYCYVFGHAMYEKMLSPYIGITCQAMLVHSSELIENCKNNQLEKIDQYVAQQWESHKITTSDDLYPFPLLGIPGLHENNTDESFYDNTDYFRPLKND